MGGTGIIDQFLETFTRYIDSGFGLVGSEVGYLATTLAAIDITMAGLVWSWGADVTRPSLTQVYSTDTGGEILATTGTGDGLAAVDLDIARSLETARRSMFYLRDRRPEAYPAVDLAATSEEMTTQETAGKMPTHA